MHSFKISIRNLCLTLFTIFFISCGGGSEQNSSGNNVSNGDGSGNISGEVIDIKEAIIISASGGTVTIPDKASVNIPAGTISTDTEITLTQVESDKLITKNPYSDIVFITSSNRPDVDGNIALTLYHEPSNGAIEDVEAYAYEESGIVYPVKSVKGNNLITISNPEIAISLSSEKLKTSRKQIADTERSTGYFLAKRDPLFSNKCTNGSVGEIHEEEGHVFKMILEVQMECSLVKSLSAMLQNSYVKYNILYKDNNGKVPFSHLSSENRMKVYIGNYSANAEYKFISWNGYILINATSAQRDSAVTEKSLYHEMFHAVEDIYSNMFIAGNLAMWWYEATAEWSAFAARDKTFEELVAFEFNLYPEMLSVPIQKSRQYRSGTLSYGFSTLINYVESQDPGYVRNTLLSWDITSGSLYQSMVSAGNLSIKYSDFIKKMMVGNTSFNYWKSVSFFEEDDKTYLTTRPNDVIGTTDFNNIVLSSDAERFKTHSYTLNLGPLTSQFILFEAKPELGSGRHLTVNLTSGGSSSGNALLYAVPYLNSNAASSQITQLDSGGTVVSGLGKENRAVYIAIFNNDITETKEFKINLKLEKSAQLPEAISSSFSIDSENWSIGARSDSFGPIFGSGTPEYGSAGGNPAGYIFYTDTGGGDDYWYFRAPSKFYKDLSVFYGKSLSFNMKQSNENPGKKLAPFVVLQGGGLILHNYDDDATIPGKDWTHISFKLDPTAGWLVRTGWSSAAKSATEGDIKKVLSGLIDLRIRGEFTNGPDTGAIDTITIGL